MYEPMHEAAKALYLERIRQGDGKGAAAKVAGVTRQGIWKACQREPGFAAAIDQAEIESCEPVEDNLRAACAKLNIIAIIFFLCNRNPARWKDARNQVNLLDTLFRSLPS